MLNSFRNPDYIIIDFLKNVDSDNSDQAERMPTLSIRRAKKYHNSIVQASSDHLTSVTSFSLTSHVSPFQKIYSC